MFRYSLSLFILSLCVSDSSGTEICEWFENYSMMDYVAKWMSKDPSIQTIMVEIQSLLDAYDSIVKCLHGIDVLVISPYHHSTVQAAKDLSHKMRWTYWETPDVCYQTDILLISDEDLFGLEHRERYNIIQFRYLVLPLIHPNSLRLLRKKEKSGNLALAKKLKPMEIVLYNLDGCLSWAIIRMPQSRLFEVPPENTPIREEVVLGGFIKNLIV